MTDYTIFTSPDVLRVLSLFKTGLGSAVRFSLTELFGVTGRFNMAEDSDEPNTDT